MKIHMRQKFTALKPFEKWIVNKLNTPDQSEEGKTGKYVQYLKHVYKAILDGMSEWFPDSLFLQLTLKTIYKDLIGYFLYELEANSHMRGTH